MRECSYLFVDIFLVLTVLTAMVAAVRWTFRGHAETTALTPRLAVGLSAGTLAGFPLASVYGASQGYAWTPGVVGVEALIVLAFLTVAILLAQRWTRPRLKAAKPA